MMRILFLSQVLPYPVDAGPKARSYHVLRHLAQKHSVTLVCFVRNTDTPAAVAHLREFCHAVHTVPLVRSRVKDSLFLLKSLVAGRPFIIERDWVAAMAQQLDGLVRDGAPYDAIHADQLWMAPYALWVRKQSNGARPRTVLDQHNAVFMIPQRMAESEPNLLKRALLQLEARKLADFEVKTCHQFDHVTWVTAEDYAAVQAQAHPPATIPNDGVIPICGSPEEVAPIQVQPGAQRLTFLGGLHYPPNAQGVLWFAREVFPHILTQHPHAVLTVLGKQPPAALNAVGIPPANLTVTGYVDDPAPYLAETAVFIVPLLAGGGMRVKIIDGWTWGLPIVSTSIGAEGIAVQPGENILIADTPSAFAQAVLELLQNPVAAKRLAQSGRAWALQCYNWRTTYTKWDQIYS
jgi:polysaccharide biosynthesis protein PslH